MSITIDHMTGARVRPRTGAPQANSWQAVPAGGHLLCRWPLRRGQRRALAELARLPHLLDDVGLTRAQALREAGKPFWRR